MKKIFLALVAVFAGLIVSAQENPERIYDSMVRSLAKGWNTWDTRSVFTQVYLPHQFAVKMSLRDADGNRAEALRIGNMDEDAAVLRPGDHAYDGSYTDVSAFWHGIRMRLRTASDGGNLVILATPLDGCDAASSIFVLPCHCWTAYQRWDSIWNTPDGFCYTTQDGKETLRFKISGSAEAVDGGFLCRLDGPVLISSIPLDVAAAEALLNRKCEEFKAADRKRFGDRYETYHAMQSVLAWDTIFDAGEHKVLTTVSRNWNLQWATYPEYGGYVIFDWDTYFAALMLSTGSRELAYANAAEITKAVDVCGFVPNYRTDHDTYTRDRSQPPVGALTVWRIYEKYREKWFLELLYDRLLTWNRWWTEKRMTDGLLCWGSDAYENVSCRQFETRQGSLLASVLESGLDNSQMYDGVQYDENTHKQDQQDVGLTSLYVADCEYLAKIATELGRRADARELRARANTMRRSMQRFWDEEDGMFFNRRIADGSLNHRCSPTSFYPLIAGVARREQADRMVNEHLLDPDEFWGEWVIPATPRNDPAFSDNTYWRGRIWAPMNYLVYEGLCNYDFPQARKALADKSEKILLQSWLSDRYVYENWSAVDGRGDDVGNSDRFYHWGALMGYIALREAGLL